MKIRHFFRRRHWDAERAREMEAHLDLHIAELVARGHAPDRARQLALVAFGNPALVKEQIYEMNSIPVVETIWRDLRYAVRVLGKSPGFTLTAVLTLAIAIAINTAVFSIVDGVLLRPLPFPEPEQLSLVEAQIDAAGVRGTRTSQHGVAWITLRDHLTIADRAVFSTWASGVNVVAGTRAIHAEQQRVGSGFFGVLGVQPLLGRELSGDEDRRGGPAAVVLSYEFWRGTLGADPEIVGRAIALRGAPHTVVGVMPPQVQTGTRADLWTALRAGPDGEGEGENFQILLRRKPGLSQAAVDGELQRLGPEINRRRPPADGTAIAYQTVPLQRGLTDALRRPLMMLWAAVAVVLLIAGVNLAGLTFARDARRAREIATRMALGSGRAAIVRQLLVESVVVAVAGAMLGILLAGAALASLEALAENALDLWQPVAIDGRAAIAACLFALITMAIAGVVPAVQSTRLRVPYRLWSGSARTVAGAASQLSRRVVVVTQVALGVVLLVAAGLLLRSFTHLRGLDPGFEARGVYAATVSLQDARYQTATQVNTLANTTIDRLRQSTGVQAAAVSLGLPYQRLLNLGFRHLDGTEAAGDARMTSATYVAGDYFTALRIPVRRGRVFEARDTAASAPVAIVNETIAREYFHGGDPVGRRIRFAGRDREIIGVVGDVQVRPGFGDRGPLAAMPLAYIPLAQASDGMLRLVHGWFATAVIVRAEGGMERVVPALRTAVDAADPLLPFADVRSMADVQGAAIALPRLLMVLLLTLAAAAVILTAIGIYGLIGSSVTERTRELGIRLALGATTGDAIRTVAAPGILLAVTGTLIGSIAARGTVTIVQTFVWGVAPTDPTTFGVVVVLFIAVSAIASVLPALRILRLDPAKTLRAE